MVVRVRLLPLVVLCVVLWSLRGPAAGASQAAAGPGRAAPAPSGQLTPPARTGRAQPLLRHALTHGPAARPPAPQPLRFEPNRGQSAPQVRFLAHGPGYTLFLTTQGAVLALTPPRPAPRPAPLAGHHRQAPPPSRPAASAVVIRLTLAGANPHARLVAAQRLPGYVNYLIGRDPRHWHTHLPTYGSVTYQGVYPGIDLVFYSHGGQLEYDWRLRPGANPRAMRLSLQGQQWVQGHVVPLTPHLDRQGTLVLATALGTLRQRVPAVTQPGAGRPHAINVRYTLRAPGRVGLRLGAYDPHRPLRVDPVLLYATYVGGTMGEVGYAVARDPSGNLYVAGNTGSSNYPLSNPYQSTLKGVNECLGAGVACVDAVLTKVNATGTALVYSTYFGGNGSETGDGLQVDGSGNAYLVGLTDSTDLPTKNAFQSTYGGTHACNPVGNDDAYLSVFSASGSALRYSSYLGGCLSERAYAVAIDTSGHAWLAGDTNSTDFPTKNAYQGSASGGTHAFVAAFDTTQSGAASLRYATYLEGNGSESASGIAVDSAGDAYVTGQTSSATYPTTPGAYQTSFAGRQDVFVTELAPGGTSLLYSTFVGGAGAAGGTALALDGAGNVDVVGTAGDSSWPTTPGAVQRSFGGGFQNAIVFQLAPRLPASQQLRWSTYLGGAKYESASGVAVDSAGSVYVAGTTQSLNFPVQNALQPRLQGSSDAYISAFAPSGTLLWSTYLGGSAQDGADAVLSDGAGHLDVVGGTASSDFPVTPNAYQKSYASPGYDDIFLAQLSANGYTPGTLPWHPHSGPGGTIGGGIGLSVDLADGHVDVSVPGLMLPGRGPDLSAKQTWDSALAQNGGSTGLVSSLTPHMSGVLTGTVTYTDRSGAVWDLSYLGALTATAPYTAYRLPPGQPWQLTTSTGGYTLTDFLTGETWTFDGQGRLVSDTDSYGNTNTLSYGSTGPTQEHNSGGRTLAVATNASGQLTDVQSPLWQQGGASQAGSQHVTYSYNGSGQLSGVTRGAGTSDAVTATFGYSGSLLSSITTPYTQAVRTWTLGYDSQGRVTSVTSPVSGSVGQAGYTPAYTTQYTYNPGQTVVVEGVGTSGALTTTYTLDGQGQATAVTDGLGQTTQTSYDQDHDVTSKTDANGNTTMSYYQYVGSSNSVGLITETVAPPVGAYLTPGSVSAPVTTTYRYDPTTADLLETDRASGGITAYAYDGHHNVITTTELLTVGSTPQVYTWRARVTQYDSYGEPIATIDGRGLTVPTTSSPVPPAAQPNGSGAAWPNLPATLATSHMTYNGYGDLTAEGTPPITTTLPSGQTQTATPVTTTYSDNADGQQTAVTSANGTTTTTGYDHLGRRVSVTEPGVTLYTGQTVTPVETTTYDGDGNVLRRQDATGALTTYSDDPLGRAVSTTNPVNGTSLITYSATQRIAAQDPQGNVTRYSYDAAGRLTSTTDPSGGITQQQYDAVGNTLAMTKTDGSGVPTSGELWSYDGGDRVLTTTLTDGNGHSQGTTLTAYDLDGNDVASLKPATVPQQPVGDLTQYSYDLTGQRTQAAEIPSGTHNPSSFEQDTYDQAGNRIDQYDPDGRLETTLYDGAQRTIQAVDSVTGTATLTTTNQYDPDGNTRSTQVVTATAGSATTTSAYNAADWVITTTESSSDGSPSLTTVYGYDAAGQERSHTIIDGSTPVTTVLDPAGRATSIGENAGGTGPYTTTFTYYPTDRPQTETLPGNVQKTMTYDGMGRVTHVGLSGPQGVPTPLSSSYDYGYAPATGWTTAYTPTVNVFNNGQPQPQSYQHDARGRLVQWSGQSNGPESWAYDNSDNIISNTEYISGMVRTTVFTYSTTVPNELVAQHTDGFGVESYGYDRRGHTVSLTSTDYLSDPSSVYAVSTTLQYDSQGRPGLITLKNGQYTTKTNPVFSTVTFGYNAQGQRSSYTVSTPGQPGYRALFRYRDTGPEVAQAIVASGTVTGTITYTDTYLYDQLGAPYALLRQYQGQALQRYWYVVDGRNNVVALTDATGAVVNRYSYDPWGEGLSTSESPTAQQPLRYGGYWWDKDLGWYWVGIRSLDPEGRWVQPDPSEHNGVRTYAYVHDDPVDASDPTGLQDEEGYCYFNEYQPIAPLPGGGDSGENPINTGYPAYGILPAAKLNFARQQGRMLTQQAQSLYDDYVQGGPITVLKALYQTPESGEKTILTVNDLYGKKMSFVEWLQNKVGALQRKADQEQWIFRGGIYRKGLSPETAPHAEDNLMLEVKRLLDSGEIADGSVVYTGISTKYFCGRCQETYQGPGHEKLDYTEYQVGTVTVVIVHR